MRYKSTKSLKTPIAIAAGILILLSGFHVNAQKVKQFKGEANLSYRVPAYDIAKKNILIVADNDGTEMFDMMAPFYLFNATGKANVFVVSERRAPILLVNSLFILPHYSFAGIDSLHIMPDVIVIPNLSMRIKVAPQKVNVDWIRNHINAGTIVLSICDGAATAAATGLYDDLPITTHASDFCKLKKQFPKAHWVKNISVTESGNFYSTAGVSNATEGSLTVIRRLFGEQTMRSVMREIRYPSDTIKVSHESRRVDRTAVVRIIGKVLFKKREHIGVLMQDDVNEFELAGLLDTYVRSFPKSINSFTNDGGKIISKYGLNIYPTGDINRQKITDLLVLDGVSAKMNSSLSAHARFITYYGEANDYPIESYLAAIQVQYGKNLMECVKLMLDYN